MSKTSDTRSRRRNPPPADHIRISEAAAITQTSPGTIYRWIRARRVHAVRHDGLLYIRAQDAQEARRTRKRSITPLLAPPKGMITTRHASNVTGAHQVSIQEWARAGKIRAYRPGPRRMWYVNLDDVKRMALESKPGRQK